ncbi:MAG: transcription termination/antitermination protein NusG [Candidatus Cloacimonetes bacterium]|nr:transcription termination/antitermination protein NusG [Candidatus Cloacimonadota bacterium]
MKWYVLHTYASHENKVKNAIEKGVLNTPLQEQLGRILIPTQRTFHIRDGKKIETEKKIFTSYIIIEADLSKELLDFILRLPGVTNFLATKKSRGSVSNASSATTKKKKTPTSTNFVYEPLPLLESEVNRLLGIAERENENAKGQYDFIPGDIVKIIDGPFSDFDGIVEKFNMEQSKLTVKVTVFGRITPVEVNADQVEIQNK